MADPPQGDSELEMPRAGQMQLGWNESGGDY
jgi:hypothetical protein